MIEEQFAEACAEVARVYTRLDHATVRKIYAYYKQATVGDVKGKLPAVRPITGAVLLVHKVVAITMTTGAMGR